MASQTFHPEVLWAQRSSSTDAAKNVVFLNLIAADVPPENLKLDLQPTKLTFEGKSTSKGITYQVELEFFAEIDPKESKVHHLGSGIELVLRKKEVKEEYWPRLLKDSRKMHFLKTDFSKYVAEDEQNEAPEDDEYMNKMNPMGGEGGGEGGFGGIDFSKLGAGGMGGMGGLEGLGGMGGLPDLQDLAENGEDSSPSEDDDDEMPALEGDDEKPAAAATKEAPAPAAAAKIQEVE
ncbi:HSP20-like chaperone [Mytilinidion resinicola]|uniref:HSP20-like chaperone n=1 Tax=Mytilinidion resinicola TaxID=574789 RepID=A0A6A6Y8J1_9PEZI|nr:HSP20-like chaperone [Mytilinidion resinicola]KAF2804929.1 HSP20-like chaperone [Mytilinidion resinicola]